MTLKPLLDKRFAEFSATFRTWFLSSNLSKSVAIVSHSRLFISLVYGSFKNKSLIVYATDSGQDFLNYLRRNSVGLICVTEKLMDMRGDDLVVQSKQICANIAAILLVEDVPPVNQVNINFKSPVVVAVDDMLKSDNALRRGFLCALGGTSYRSPSIQANSSENSSIGIIQLSDTERKILEFYAAGLTINEMVEELPFSKNTVKTYSRNLLAKLGVGNRQKALLKALELGLIGNIFKSTRSQSPSILPRNNVN
jgi:DNA-binding NarL/FixJ family response regulator